MSTDEKQPAREPWEQREDESPQAFRAFVFYRDLGLERSLNKAYRASIGDETGEKAANGTWDRWSSEYDWVERSRAYDSHVDALRRNARERKLAELEARRFEFELENQGLLENWVRNLDEKLWVTLQEGFTETKEERVIDRETGELVVVKRETKVKFPALGSFARLLEARNDTGRQAVEGPRKKPDTLPAVAQPAESAADKPDAPGSSTPNEFVWIAPPPSEDDAAGCAAPPAESETPPKGD